MDELLCNLCVSEPPVRQHSLCRQHFFPFRTPGFALTLEIYALYIPPCQSPCVGRAAQPSLKWYRIKRFILQMWGNRRGWRDGYPVKLSQANTESVGSVQRQFMKGIQAFMLQLLWHFHLKVQRCVVSPLQFFHIISNNNSSLNVQWQWTNQRWETSIHYVLCLLLKTYANTHSSWNEFIITRCDVTKGTDSKPLPHSIWRPCLLGPVSFWTWKAQQDVTISFITDCCKQRAYYPVDQTFFFFLNIQTFF